MREPVTHVNLLQRSAPVYVVGMLLAAVMTVTLGGLGFYGAKVVGEARQARARLAAVDQQVKGVQAQLAALNGEQTRNARSIALGKEIDALKPQAEAAKQLADALGGVAGGPSDGFARALGSLGGLSEPGLWLTGVTVTSGGKKLEVTGQARSGTAVLNFARKANDALRPMAVRLETLDVQGAAAAAAAPGEPVGNGLVTFKLN